MCFSHLVVDIKLYIYEEDGLVAVIVIYVYDLIITGNHSQFIASTKQKLLRDFDMINLFLLHFLLGLEIW